MTVSPSSLSAPPRPLLRGVLHQAAFSVSLVVGTLLIVGADGTRRQAIAALFAAGGLAYTAGAIIYARRRPNPLPAVFGYHELFHALTLVAVACQYVAIAFFVIRSG